LFSKIALVYETGLICVLGRKILLDFIQFVPSAHSRYISADSKPFELIL